ncbi:MAG: MFS transporter [Desulfobacula sp.]|nr:MFS transporter [Desulfobacula sp.]
MAVFQKKWIIFCLVATSIFMSTLDSSIVNIALPYIMQDLKTDLSTIQWVVLIYLIVVSCFLLSFGRLSDIKGRKPVYITGFAIFAAGSLFCGTASGASTLICARAIQGSGAAMLMACSPAMIVDTFPVKERGKALGMIGAVVAAGLTTGPVIGGILLEFLSWQYIFYINIPIGIVAAFGAMSVLKDEYAVEGSSEPMDLIGSFLLVILISSLIVFMTQLSKWGVISILSFLFVSIFILAGIGFVINEKKSRYPLFDLKLLTIKLFIFPVISSTILFAALFIIIFMMPFFLTYPCGFSAYKTGMIMIVPFIFLLFFSPAAGIMYDKFRSRNLCMAGMGIVLLSLLSLMTVKPSMDDISILWRMALAGLGTALFISPNNTAIMSCVPLQRRGTASGAVATARNLGMVVGVALAGLIFSTSFANLTNGASLENYLDQMEPYFMIGFKRTMAMGAAISFFGLFITWARGKE